MDHTRLKRARCEGPITSEEPSLDVENLKLVHQSFPSLSIPLQPFASAGQHSESSATYFSWPASCQISDAAQERANYFSNLQKGLLPQVIGRLPQGQQATTLLDLMTIRAFHSKILRCYSLGTAVGFRIRKGVLTNIPAILVFVSRKVRRQWLNPGQCLPTALEGPGGVWCEVDVLEFSHFGALESSPKEQLYDKIMDDLRGNDPCIGSGSQVASQEIFGTLSAIVRSQTGSRQVGFLTNRHVAVDLDYPSQKMFHPLPPNLGPGVYLGAVERATSYITDYLWYGIFAGSNPETFVRADGAFIPFVDGFNISTIRTSVKSVGTIGDVKHLDLQSPISSLLGKRVMKVGRSSGLTYGVVLAYSLEYNDEKGVCFLNDFLVVGENKETFDLEGDSGSLIMLVGEQGEKPTPIGIIWGGASNRGRLKSKVGCAPENWTIGVDLGRLLNLLDLDLITTTRGLKEAMREQMAATATTLNAALRDSSYLNEPPLDLQIQSHSVSNGPFSPNISSTDLNLEDGPKLGPNAERQFIPGFVKQSPQHSIDQGKIKVEVSENLSALRNGSDEDLCVSLQLGDNELKCRKSRASSSAGKPNQHDLELM